MKRTGFWLQAILAVTISTAALIALVTFPRSKPFLQFENKVQIAAFATLPLFVLTVLQLRHSVRLQRAAFVKDYVSKLHTDKELSQAFHYLIYTYSDDLYDAFLKANEPKKKEMQGTRGEGCRLYDPGTFQGSEEERRLDVILSYFDVIGYHYAHGSIEMRDIANVLGFKLALLSKRKVVVRYLDDVPDYLKRFNEKYKGTPVAIGPFRYLTVMLKEFEAYNAKHHERIEKFNNNILKP